MSSNGRRTRQAARIMLFDQAGRLLLLHGFDQDDPGHQWWFTVGGGLEEGEDARRAAVRELREETGIDLSPSRLVGPILRRRAVFHFAFQDVLQEEEFFWAQIEGEGWPLDESGRTELERKVVDSYRWMSTDELEQVAASALVYPRCLPELARRWAAGWDGVCLTLSEE